MLNDFEMVTHEFDRPITIIPISDVHFGALEHLQKEWTDFCKMVEQFPDTYIVLGGDLINNNVRTCSFINPYDELIRPREQKKRMVEFLEPIKDRILCCVSGNHEARSAKDDDVDITYDIMAKLDIEDIYRPIGNVIEGLDCLIVGHTHKGTVSKPSKIVIDRKNNHVSMSHYTVISMVSWLNYGGYAMKKMLLPAHVADPQKLRLFMCKNEKKIEVVW